MEQYRVTLLGRKQVANVERDRHEGRVYVGACISASRGGREGDEQV